MLSVATRSLLLTQPQTGLRRMTLSAGVGTDDERLAALTGDGLAQGSGLSVYPAATNLLANTNGDVDTTGLTDNSSTTTAVASTAKFNGRAFQVVSGNAAANEGPSQAITGGLASTQYTISAWAWLISGAATVRATLSDSVSGKQGGTAVALTAVPQKIQVTATTGAVSITQAAYVETTVQQAGTWAFGGWQVETGTVATPYVANGGTRVAGRVQLGVQGLFTGTQGWFAAAVRMGWASTVAPSSNAMPIFNWSDDGNNRITCQVSETANSHTLTVRRRYLGSITDALSSAAAFAQGGTGLFVGAWDAVGLAASAYATAFVTAADTNYPVLAATSFDMSQGALSSLSEIRSSFRWYLVGKGSRPTAADVALMNTWGTTVPTLAQIAMLSASARPTCLVPCRTMDAILLDAYYRPL